VESSLLWCLKVFQFKGGSEVHSKPQKFTLLPKSARHAGDRTGTTSLTSVENENFEYS
jgi:hypothetical protein